MKKTLFFVLTLLLLSACVLPAFAAAPTVKVIDNANRLTAEEEGVLQTALTDSKNDVLYFVVTDASRRTTYPSDQTVINTCGFSNTDAAVVLWIYHDGTQYRYDMYKFGRANDLISKTAVNNILDDSDVYDNLKGGRMAAGARAFLTAADGEYTKAVEKEARREATRVPRSIGVGLLVGAVAGGIAVLIVVIVYHRKQHGEIYPLDRYARLDLTVCQDRFIGSYVTRVRVNNSSSSSGGRSGGGGGFSGGHAGGR